jgi:ribosome biogenesis SPOUT family RNA methylase Rps3
MKPTTLTAVLVILGVALVMCLGGVIALSLQEPARAIPDILVGTTTLIVGGILGLLAPSRPTA